MIVTCFTGGLALSFLVVFGLSSKWGANQWGPVASWVAGLLAGGAFFAALWQARIARQQAGSAQQQAQAAQQQVTAAQQQAQAAQQHADDAKEQSRRSQVDRLVDHEVSRRRECIEALGDDVRANVGRFLSACVAANSTAITEVKDEPREVIEAVILGQTRAVETLFDALSEQLGAHLRSEMFATYFDALSEHLDRP